MRLYVVCAHTHYPKFRSVLKDYDVRLNPLTYINGLCCFKIFVAITIVCLNKIAFTGETKRHIIKK